jgi:hypothetical protein
MSSPNDPTDYGQLAKDGVISSALGSSAAVARALLSPSPVGFIWMLRSAASAAVVAVLVGLAVTDYVSSYPLRLAVAGLAGFAAPEVTNFALSYLNKRFQQKLDEVKSNAKSKTKPKPKKRR